MSLNEITDHSKQIITQIAIQIEKQTAKIYRCNILSMEFDLAKMHILDCKDLDLRSPRPQVTRKMRTTNEKRNEDENHEMNELMT